MSDCFIIMPISTLPYLQPEYNSDNEHFAHVLECLFAPAIELAGMNPVPPSTTGSDIIQGSIINSLVSADLVLCDMSALNPNVFFELGIRTALDKPVAIVIDDKTTSVPFDTSIINFHKYKSGLQAWSLDAEIKSLAKHLTETNKKSKRRNMLWKYFGIEQSGAFNPDKATSEDKFDVILAKIESLEQQRRAEMTDSEIKERLQRFENTNRGLQYQFQQLVPMIPQKLVPAYKKLVPMAPKKLVPMAPKKLVPMAPKKLVPASK